MPEVAGTLLSHLAARVRDPQFTATAKDDMRRILSDCQRAYNAKREAVIADVTFTADARRMFFAVTGDITTEQVRITDVFVGDKQLTFCPYDNLKGRSLAWFRDVGPEHHSWSLLGRDILIIYPSVDKAVTVTVSTVKLTTELVNDLTATEIPDSELPAILDLAEAIIDIKQREFVNAKPAIERFAARIGVEMPK